DHRCGCGIDHLPLAAGREGRPGAAGRLRPRLPRGRPAWCVDGSPDASVDSPARRFDRPVRGGHRLRNDQPPPVPGRRYGIVAAYLVVSLPIEILRWLVLVVVLYAAAIMFRASWIGRRAGTAAAEPVPVL